MKDTSNHRQRSLTALITFRHTETETHQTTYFTPMEAPLNVTFISMFKMFLFL